MQVRRYGLSGWILAALFFLAQAGVQLFGEELPDPAHLISKLNLDNFDERNAAFAALEKLGEDARKALETALAANPKTEARRGIERLLAKLPPKRAIYAKLLLPGGATGADNPIVESWIAKDLKLNDECKLQAISEWCLIKEEASTPLLNEIRCNIPVAGHMARKSGKIEVSFTIHGPAHVPVSGNVVNDEMGIRAVASIGNASHPHAYVALMVGPESSDAAAYQKVPDPNEKPKESFKP